jgi:TRAP-type C4-dicarboxylate transport system permease small subunit
MVVSYTAVFLGMIIMTFYFLVDLLADIKTMRGHFGQGSIKTEGSR